MNSTVENQLKKENEAVKLTLLDDKYSEYDVNKIIKITQPKRKRKQEKIKLWLKQKFYISTWIRDYSLSFAINDLIAGITLGLTMIPESIACALLAGLPTHYGLYSSFIGPFVYVIFGTVSKVLIGPTSLVALVTVQFTMKKPIEFAFILTFLAGIVEFLMGILRLGFIFDFISMPVIKAFTSATAILVAESQIKVILGIKYLVPGFINSIQTLFYKLNESRLGDAIFGISSIVFLVCFQLLSKIPINESKPNGKLLKIILNYISLSRNALIVLISGVIAFIWVSKLPQGMDVPFRLSENIVPGLPNITIPSLYIVADNKTYNFLDICSELGIGIFVIPLVSILTNISIAKALTPKGLVNASQELAVLGICNIIGSSVQSMPTCGAFSRAAISSASGIKTSIAGVYSGMIVIFALGLLTPYFHYIPESVLAAIVICAIVTLIDFKLPIQLWRECKRDFITWISCFCVCIFFGVEIGLFYGIGLTSAHLLFLWARPDVTVKIQYIDEFQYIYVSPNNGLYFPGIDYLRQKILKACIQAEFQIPVVIDCSKITGLDYTAAQGLSKLAKDLDDGCKPQALLLYNLQENFQKLMHHEDNLMFCENEQKLREFLTQEALRNGVLNLKEHIRASIDLGYKIDS